MHSGLEHSRLRDLDRNSLGSLELADPYLLASLELQVSLDCLRSSRGQLKCTLQETVLLDPMSSK